MAAIYARRRASPLGPAFVSVLMDIPLSQFHALQREGILPYPTKRSKSGVLFYTPHEVLNLRRAAKEYIITLNDERIINKEGMKKFLNFMLMEKEGYGSQGKQER